MFDFEPSRTALAAARHRAAHQILENGEIFYDPLAHAILGGDPQEVIDEARAHPNWQAMRRFVCARAHFAEEVVAMCVSRGTAQCVVLGAGLDTFAYRNPFAGRLRVFEVDHPATGAWKIARLRAAGIASPPWLQQVPLNFEKDDVVQTLGKHGFDFTQPAVFIWLGVLPYLTEGAIFGTLSMIGEQRADVSVIFDYADPPELYDPAHRKWHDRRAGRVAALGEPWITYYTAPQLHAKLDDIGFHHIEDLNPRQMARRYFPRQAGRMGEIGGHVIHARKIPHR